MEIHVRRHSGNSWVVVKDGSTTIDIGPLNDEDRDDLAQVLIDAAYEIGPKSNDDCDPWFISMLEKCGINLPKQQEEDA